VVCGSALYNFNISRVCEDMVVMCLYMK